MTVGNNASSRNDTGRDEDLARALQEQFHREVEQLASPSAWSQIQGVFGSNGSGTAAQHPRSSPATGSGTGSSGSRPRPPRTPTAPPRRSNNNNINSIDKSNRKKAEIGSSPDNTAATSASGTPSPDRANSRRGSPRSSPRGSPRTSPRGSPRASPRNSFSLTSPMFVGGGDSQEDITLNDETVARRLEQELRDADLASTIALAERAAADFDVIDQVPVVGGNANVVALPHATVSDGFVGQTPPSRGGRGRSRRATRDPDYPPDDCRGKAIYYTLRIGSFVLVAGIFLVVWITMFGSRTGNDALDPSTWIPGYPESDPSMGSVGEHNRWRSGDGATADGGLTLTVLNNLREESDWNEHLESSIREWDDGDPDALTLNVRSMDHDPDCRAVRRAMKVCNANYGPTDWRGVNQILLQDEYIITSLAKMNDYYLEGTNKAQKQYTMCHELGHGLGLGHSDENFHNKDLGNCMDYTARPQNNMHPDRSNFESLEQLYGNVDGTVRVQKMQTQGDRRMGDDKEESLREEEEFRTYASYLMDPIEVLGSAARHLRHDSGGEWRLLSKTDVAEHHERQLGNGYSIRTSILLA